MYAVLESGAKLVEKVCLRKYTSCIYFGSEMQRKHQGVHIMQNCTMQHLWMLSWEILPCVVCVDAC